VEKLRYGFKAMQFVSNSQINSCVFYINHKNFKVINYCVPGVKRVEEIIMSNITSINFGKNNGNFIERPEHDDVKKIHENRCLTIRLSKDFIDLIFDYENDLNNFVSAMAAFFTDNYIEKECEE
jgi:hypothetical protein